MDKYFKKSKKGKDVNVEGGLFGGGMFKSSYSKREIDSDFNRKYDYYVQFSHLMRKLYKAAPSIKDAKDGVTVNIKCVKVGKGKAPEVDKLKFHVRYLGFRVNKSFEFWKLNYCSSMEDDPENPDFKILYVPIVYILDWYNTSKGRFDYNREFDLFSCTNDTEIISDMNIFSLCTDVFLATKRSTKFRNVKVIV